MSGFTEPIALDKICRMRPRPPLSGRLGSLLNEDFHFTCPRCARPGMIRRLKFFGKSDFEKWTCPGCSATLCFLETRPLLRFVAFLPFVPLSTGVIQGPLWATLPLAILAALGINRFSRMEVAAMPDAPASQEWDQPATPREGTTTPRP